MGDAIFLEAMLQSSLCAFPMLHGRFLRDTNMERCENDPNRIQIINVMFHKQSGVILTTVRDARREDRVQKAHQESRDNFNMVFQYSSFKKSAYRE